MAVDAPSWMIYLVDFLVFVLFVVGIIFLMAFRMYRNAQGKIIAEVWEPSGYPVRKLTKWDRTGKTVEVDGCTYFLSKELTSKEKDELLEQGIAVYPSHRYTNYGFWPFKAILRIESWERNNPEPIRPRYDKPVMTAAEITASKNEIQATTLAMDIQENQERQKQLTNAIANQPNKLVVYILGIGTMLLSFVTLIIVWQLTGD